MEKTRFADMTAAQREQLLKLARSAKLQRKEKDDDGISSNGAEAPVLSFAQRRLWLLAQLDGAAAAYHIPLGLRLSGTLDAAALQRALRRIGERHAALRARFVTVDGEPQLRIAAPEEESFAWRMQDLSQLAPAQAEVQAESLSTAAALEPFDLERGPLARALLLCLGRGDYLLHLTLHHIVADGWSVAVLLRELSSLYGAFVAGETDPLPPLPVQYHDYASWQVRQMDGELLRQQTEYWRSALSGAPALLELPLDRARPARQDYSGAYAAFRIEAGQAQGLRELSQRHGVTLFMTLMAAWALLLCRLAGQQQVVVGTPSANRQRREVEDLIGCFVNTLALRIDLGNNPSVAQLLAQVKAQTLAAQQHQDLPFEQVIGALQPQRSMAHSPLFQAMFAWQSDPFDQLRLPGLTLSGLDAGRRTGAKFDLSLSLREVDGAIEGGLEYATALFDAQTVERYLGYLKVLLAGLAQDDMQAVDRIAILDKAERAQMLHGWNRTERDYRRDLCLHEIIEEQVRLRPQAVAVEDGERRLSYRELDEQANQLARQLRAMGVGPDQRVALCLERSAEMVVGLLAVLKAGGAYVPLDPGYPAERLAFMLSDSAPRVLLTQGAVAEGLALPDGLPVLHLDGAERPWLELSAQALPVAELGLTPSHLAYVIYTSGSTGQPKGVMNEHVGIVNRLLWMQEAYHLQPEEAVLQKTPFSFDVSVWEFFWPLMRGARLVMARPDGHKDPSYLADTVAGRGITTLHFVPSMLQAFLDSGEAARCTGLKRVLCSGEALPATLARRFLQELPGVELHNLYGPTEAAVDVTAWHCAGPELPDNIPLGRPVANTRIYVLDRHGQPVPAGVAGEIHIGGVQVARGYLNRPELTRERFVPDPFAGEADARLYKTGDQGRWLADGTLEYLGRNDHQVKLRGQRIELGEIEAQLLRQSDVREAVVLAREDNPGDQRLVAYLVAACALDMEMLRAQLARVLPDHMIPAAFVQLDSLPLTPNGKLDRKALPAPDGAAYRQRGYEAPLGATETALAAIWTDLLQLEQVGRHDHFFELGGHSLLALRMIARLRQACALEATLADLFAQPMLADLARHLDQAPVAAAKLPPIVPAAPAERAALSFAQQRLWFLAQMDGAGAAYHLPLALQLKGALDGVALRCALARIVARHESLRTSFVLENGEPVQRIGAADGFVLREDNLEALEPAEAQVALQRLVQDEAAAPFDLAHGPLLRARLLRLDEQNHVLLLTQHHIVSDGWSMGVFLNELEALYGAFATGAPDPLPPLALQYADYAAWQRRWLSGAVLQTQLDYWRQTLQGAPALLELPVDRPRPARQDYMGAWLPCRLDAALTEQLRALSQRHGTSLFMTLLASWALLLGRLAGQEEVVVGAPSANRGQAESEQLIGFFVNTLALRIDLSGAPSVAQLLARVKAQALAAQQHQELPFEQVVEALRPERSLAYSPLFQTVFVWQNTPRRELALPGLSASTLEAPHRTAKFDLSLILREDGGTIEGGIEYATALFDAATAERYLGYWRELLAGLVAGDAQPAAGLALLTAAQRVQLLEQGRGEVLAYPAGQCIHELIEEQAAARPQALAVAGMGRELSYAELNAQANRLAHHLRGLGVGPDVRVALCLERGPEMVLALLAVLKAGGAYVPLDPAYPAERLAYMLGDSAPAVLLTQAELGETLKAPLAALQARGQALPLLDVARDARLWSGQPDGNPPRAALTASHLAYIIYTSGSTGQPKGVMVRHQNLVHSTWARRHAYGEYGRFLLLSPISFDSSVAGIFGTLCWGGALFIAAADTVRDPHRLCGEIAAQRIESLLCVPSLMQQVLEAPGAVPEALVRVIVAGEACPRGLPDRMAQRWPQARLYNEYGPTEATVWASVHTCGAGVEEGAVPIGRPIANSRIYILDEARQLVPPGVRGEIHIGGAGVALGYQNREDLSAQRFLADPFSGEAEARMYRSGDMARWLPDGSIEFLGRDDFQVKLRGFRIELGEIEACLAAHPDVAEAAVLADGSGNEMRLLAYYVDKGGDPGTDALRRHLQAHLPAHMVPAACTRMPRMPLTPNGKLDRKALPQPEGPSCTGGGIYAEPEGALEQRLAAIWSTLLKIKRIGRHDNFFELGAHSLMLVGALERMREQGLHADVQGLFMAPTVAGLAAALVEPDMAPLVPANLIPQWEAGQQARITPEMLPLVQLTQTEIDGICATVEGGAANVQDIYPLAPLQEGILYHHVTAQERDPYVMAQLMSFDSRERLDAYLSAWQAVIARHDMLRTAVLWQGLSQPVQVVWRHAELPVREVRMAAGTDLQQRMLLEYGPSRLAIDIAKAPLLKAVWTHDTASGRWLLLSLSHHLGGDHTALDVMQAEIDIHLLQRQHLLAPALPFRDFIAHTRSAGRQQEDEAFFHAMLGDVDETTLPAGLAAEADQPGTFAQARMKVDTGLSLRLRAAARRLSVSAASLHHLAWALVLARLSGREDVVFGTVLFGRMQGGSGADRALGLFMNTLPLRMRIDGAPLAEAVRLAHAALAGLMRHEHASLALAQRCSAIAAPAPLFSALLNYRHSAAQPAEDTAQASEGIQRLAVDERNSYPLTLAVDDLGQDFGLTAQVQGTLAPERVCRFMHAALKALVTALSTDEAMPLHAVDVLPPEECREALAQWQSVPTVYPRERCVHQLFEEQAAATPQAVALLCNGQELSYAELNARANRLARHLRRLGAGPDQRVAVCLERGPQLLIALLAVLKAGAAYVPLDPAHPAERLAYTLDDCAPLALLTQGEVPVWASQPRQPVLDLQLPVWEQESTLDLAPDGLQPAHLAYVIYTSGSTGKPKGVMVEHRGVVNFLHAMHGMTGIAAHDRVLSLTTCAFDISVLEMFLPLSCGAGAVLLRQEQASDAALLAQAIAAGGVTLMQATPATWSMLLDGGWPGVPGLKALCGGEAMTAPLAQALLSRCGALWNVYGPTETTVWSSALQVTQDTAPAGTSMPLGAPIANTSIYLLDGRGRPVPAGVAGEICIGGDGVARGYLNRPELTQERFVPDPFSESNGARLYRTGDLGRRNAEGMLEFLGRNDFQLKLRGYRIEAGEIEALLAAHPALRQAVVVARSDGTEAQLVAYCVAQEGYAPDAQELRQHLAAALPPYMVPAAYVLLEALPLTANGKLDRRALPAPDGGAYARRGFEAPQGPVEQALAEIWATVLKQPRIGRHDNFFELGGHSLLVIALLEAMRQRGLHVEARSLFTATTLAGLAALTEEIEEIRI